MIALSVANYPVVEDTTDDSHIDQNDVIVTLTYAEHEMMCDILCQAETMIDFACPYGIADMPIDSELVQRYTMVEKGSTLLGLIVSTLILTMKFTDLNFKPHSIDGGVLARHFFPNGYGVSVVRFPGSYGYEQDLYEVAVIQGNEDNYDLCYDTTVTDDVMGHRDEVDVENIMEEVQAL